MKAIRLQKSRPGLAWNLRVTSGFLFGVLALAGCHSKNLPSQAQSTAVPVVVTRVLLQTVPLEIHAVGNVQAYSNVSVRSQVTGELLSVHFKEGDSVRKGDLLFLIDPRPFQAALGQAEANLARDTASLNQAKAVLARDKAILENGELMAERDRVLVERNLIAQQDYDTARTTAKSEKATVLADESAIGTAMATIRADEEVVRNAKVQLEYTVIRSPLDGRTGNLLVHAGNLVNANDTANPLVVINQIYPVFVTFSVPEQDFAEIARYMQHGSLSVEAVPSQRKIASRGKLSFVDNAVNTATGTIQLKGIFPNEDRALWPGQFVNVRLVLAKARNIVLPSQAIQTGQQGQFVFVVTPELVVESRTVTTGETLGSLTVVTAGLRAGEQVVTDGQLRLIPGAKVEIRHS